MKTEIKLDMNERAVSLYIDEIIERNHTLEGWGWIKFKDHEGREQVLVESEGCSNLEELRKGSEIRVELTESISKIYFPHKTEFLAE